MEERKRYNPNAQSNIQKYNDTVPYIFQSPNRYVQKSGLIKHIGDFIAHINGSHAGIILSKGAKARHSSDLEASLRAVHLSPLWLEFNGESSWEEISRLSALVLSSSPPIDVILAIGGGKTIDTGKAVAFQTNKPSVVIPTLASTDAPCSAISMIYSPDGAFKEAFYFPCNPAAVLVDSTLVAKAPVRYLISGMGDALATRYEAEACLRSAGARNCVGGRPTATALALSKLSAEVLYEYGEQAVKDCKAFAEGKEEVTEAIEKVIEANTLLSGLGFESGGLALAHGLHNALTTLPETKKALHGEKVAVCTVVQLILEERKEEAEKVANFCVRVGLPVSMEQLGLKKDERREAKVRKAIEGELNNPHSFMHNEPVKLDVEIVWKAIQAAEKLATQVLQANKEE